jgi:hypothetical protein
MLNDRLVFLRLLEDHEGLLFLTTNRIATIDAAFESRIHLALVYPELDAAARRSVWANFSSRGVDHESARLSEIEIDQLAQLSMNGRHIMNTFKTAYLLAKRAKERLSAKHVTRALKVTHPALATKIM